MSTLPLNEVARFFHSYGLKYELKLIEEWMSTDPYLSSIDGESHQISEEYIL